jgi:hypothetical protein
MESPEMVERCAPMSPGDLAQFAAELKPCDGHEMDTAPEGAVDNKRASA